MVAGDICESDNGGVLLLEVNDDHLLYGSVNSVTVTNANFDFLKLLFKLSIKEIEVHLIIKFP